MTKPPNSSNPAKPIVLIAEPIADGPRDWLAQRAVLIQAHDPQTLQANLADADAIIVRTYTFVDQALLERAPKLRVIARAGVGLDNIDLDACRARGIEVVHTPKANTHAVVEYVIAMTLNALRPIVRFDRSVDTPLDTSADQSHWNALRAAAISPTSIVGSRLGIIGLGSIGSALAIAADALGMHIAYHDIQPVNEPILPTGRSCTKLSLDELARTCQVISVHVDGRASNHNLLAQPFFDQLRSTCLLLNTSRGFVLDESAAARFAASNPKAALILDVHADEPITDSSPLNTLPNVIRTPHIAAGTQGAKEQMSWVVRDVIAVLDGHPPTYPARPTKST